MIGRDPECAEMRIVASIVSNQINKMCDKVRWLCMYVCTVTLVHSCMYTCTCILTCTSPDL